MPAGRSRKIAKKYKLKALVAHIGAMKGMSWESTELADANGTEHVAIEGELAAVNRVELFQWPGRVPLPALARLRAACHVSNMSHSSPMTQRRAESLPFIIPQSNFE